MHAEERQRECSQRHSEVRAGRLSGRFRLRAYRTVQTRPVSSRSVYHVHGIFTDVYFYTQSLQRPHKQSPMASRREQVSALFFVAWTQRRLTEGFPWATEGPNPPKETLTFKKEFFWQTTAGSLPAGLNGVSSSKWWLTNTHLRWRTLVDPPCRHGHSDHDQCTPAEFLHALRTSGLVCVFFVSPTWLLCIGHLEIWRPIELHPHAPL